jgi:hypothetical protein
MKDKGDNMSDSIKKLFARKQVKTKKAHLPGLFSFNRNLLAATAISAFDIMLRKYFSFKLLRRNYKYK